MQLKITRTENPTPDSVSLYFERPEFLKTFKAGQYGNFSFDIDGIIYKRTYSFHTSPADKEAGITVRMVNDGIVSNYLQSAKTYSIVLDDIGGEFVLNPKKEMKRHLFMFAGGSGITPIFSMLQTLLQEEPRSTVSLIYSNKSYSRIIFKDELHGLEASSLGRLKVHHILTQEEAIPADFPVFYKGRLSPLITKKIIKGIRSEVNYNVEYYMCGPMELMEVIASTVRAIGPGHPPVKSEIFYVPPKKNQFDISTLLDREIIIQEQDEEKLVIVKRGRSILQAAIEHRIKVPFSCTEGQCGTCRAMLISGEVKLRKNHILTDEELNDGQILLCQGFPVSEGIIIKTGL